MNRIKGFEEADIMLKHFLYAFVGAKQALRY